MNDLLAKITVVILCDLAFILHFWQEKKKVINVND